MSNPKPYPVNDPPTDRLFMFTLMESIISSISAMLDLLNKPKKPFSSLIEGMNAEMSTSVSGGARIHCIFQSISVKSLEPPTLLRPTETHSENEAIENAVTKLLLKSYYGIVMKNVQDSVPKAITHFLRKLDSEHEANRGLKTQVLSFVNGSEQLLLKGATIRP